MSLIYTFSSIFIYVWASTVRKKDISNLSTFILAFLLDSFVIYYSALIKTLSFIFLSLFCHTDLSICRHHRRRALLFEFSWLAVVFDFLQKILPFPSWWVHVAFLFLFSQYWFSIKICSSFIHWFFTKKKKKKKLLVNNLANGCWICDNM